MALGKTAFIPPILQFFISFEAILSIPVLIVLAFVLQQRLRRGAST